MYVSFIEVRNLVIIFFLLENFKQLEKTKVSYNLKIDLNFQEVIK